MNQQQTMWAMGGRSLSCALLALTLMTGPTLAANPACPNLTPVKNTELAYQDWGNRCEGMYSRDVVSKKPELHLVSLTRGRIEFDWSPDVVLRLTVPATVEHAVHIRGLAIPTGTYYQMDAIVEPGRELEWPVGDILYPGGIFDERLGVLGWTEGRTPRVYIPLRIQTGPGSATGGPAIAVVRASVNAEYLKWSTWTVRDGRCTEESLPVRPPDRRLEKGIGRVIELDSGRASELCIGITAQPMGTDGPTTPLYLEFRMVH